MNVICYIDGFNLYHGLQAKRWNRYYWLDLGALAERFLLPGQVLVEVVYCTTKVKNDPAAQRRQLTYLDALMAHRPALKLSHRMDLEKIDARLRGRRASPLGLAGLTISSSFIIASL